MLFRLRTAVSSTLGSSNPVSSTNKYLGLLIKVRLASTHYFLCKINPGIHFQPTSIPWIAEDVMVIATGGAMNTRIRNKDIRIKAIVDNFENYTIIEYPTALSY